MIPVYPDILQSANKPCGGSGGEFGRALAGRFNCTHSSCNSKIQRRIDEWCTIVAVKVHHTMRSELNNSTTTTISFICMNITKYYSIAKAT